MKRTSSLEADQIRQYPIRTPYFIIPNGINMETYVNIPRRGFFRKRFNIPDNALVLVMIGRLHGKKNPQTAVNALISSQMLPKEVHLLLVGPDQENFSGRLAAQAKKAGCLKCLHFTGLLNRDELKKAISDSDLLLMPSEDENFGMSAAEAMAAGLPILTSDNVPVGLWAKEGNAGEVSSLDHDAFSKKAVDLLSRPNHLKDMGNTAKILAKDLFDQRIVAKNMLSNLEDLIRSKKSNGMRL